MLIFMFLVLIVPSQHFTMPANEGLMNELSSYLHQVFRYLMGRCIIIVNHHRFLDWSIYEIVPNNSFNPVNEET